MADFTSIFNEEYTTFDNFRDGVLIPIFGRFDSDKAELNYMRNNESLRRAASDANITAIHKMGELDTLGSPIEVFEIVLSDKCNIERSRVNIQNVVRRELQYFCNAFIIFRYEPPTGKSWRFSFVYKGKSQTDSTTAKRFTYVFGKDYSGRTANERFNKLLGKIDAEGDCTIEDEDLLNAFSVEALSDEFFAKYKAIYANFVQYITGKRVVKTEDGWKEEPKTKPSEILYNAFDRDDKRIRDYIKKMMGRITFLYFLQRKGWLDGDFNYMQHLFEKSKKEYQNDFLDRVLEPLFYTILNTDKPERKNAFIEHNKNRDRQREVEWDVDLLDDWKNLPFLNGGLFERDENDIVRTQFPAYFFKNKEPKNYINAIPGVDYEWEKVPGVLDFFDQYNFTIDENDPDDAEVGIDPEMLGRIFENLLEDNNDKGAFYTPKEVVQYMCRESLITYLQTDVHDEPTQEQLRNFVENPNEKTLSTTLAKETLQKIRKVKICDPAIGSGAFPMGLLNLLVACTENLNEVCGEKENRLDIKKHIIQNSIYGVDIERGAIDIARLRFWLSLVVDEDIAKPLPNFEYKFMQGNSLLEQLDDNVDLSILLQPKKSGELDFSEEKEQRELLQEKLNDYFVEENHQKKDKIRREIEETVRKLVLMLTAGDTKVADKISTINLSGNDQFFLWHTWFADVFEKGGFDIVIGNPPYIPLQKNEGVLADLYETKGFNTFVREGDIYALFYEFGHKLLKPNATLCYITSDKWMCTGYGGKLRDFLTKEANPCTLIDFRQTKLFDDATVETNILLFTKSPYNKNTKCSLLFRLGKKDRSKIGHFIKQNTYSNRFDAATFWFVTSIKEKNIKTKLEQSGTALTRNQWGIKINRGITTGYNDAFIISTEQRESILSQCESLTEKTKTNELILPIITGKQTDCFFTEWKGSWIISTFPSKQYDIEDYPAIKSFLLSFGIERLEQTGEKYIINGKEIKARKKNGTNKWFEIQDTIAFWKDFYEPKLFWKRVGSIIRFSYDENKMACLDSTCIATGNNLKYLTGFFNSNIGHFLLQYSPRTGTGDLLISKQAIDPLKVLVPNDKQNETISKIVDQIIDAKKKKQPTIEEELKIDTIMYLLYGLTYDEVMVIENALTTVSVGEDETDGNNGKKGKKTESKQTVRRIEVDEATYNKWLEKFKKDGTLPW